ncbi:hypothetical protein TBR22_A13320 [Luteitalea sp. TBR-22]|uniref:hypothetical protein n=1 Tax=Luteitalea sp. TBR-22 TaxID=2802971 RepID=UPI001AF1FABD|nr:hypothetical protein [Luteitalea sp. TBR-22]BCS32123.1 hypothetical protein TBR22_A13320 [Luteitalea sp. TBR-22]
MLRTPVVRSILRAGAVALVIGALVPASPAFAQKGKPVPNSTVSVTFADRLGDALTSDNGTPYPGGVLFSAAEGDLRLDIGAAGRLVKVELGTPITAPVGEAPPTGTYWTDAVLFIENLRGVAVGSTVTRLGRIGLGSAYPNHALGFRQTTIGGVEIYGTPVCVSRPTAAEWVVASSGCVGETSDTAGLFEENIKRVGQRFKATYAVPFAFTVACTANCPQ